MNSFHHSLQRCFIELDIQDEDQGFMLQEKLAHLFKNKILPKLAEVLDGVVLPDEVLSIDTMSIDLHFDSPRELEEKLGIRLLEKITGALQTINIPKRPLATLVWEQFLEFLSKGNATGAIWQDKERNWEAKLMAILDEQKALEIKEHLGNPQVIPRMVGQLSVHFWRTLLKTHAWKKEAKILEPLLSTDWNSAQKQNFVHQLNTIAQRAIPKRDYLQPVLPGSKQINTTFYHSNAGIILVYPFLEPLFEHLGWVEAGQFKSSELQNTAILLIDYMASGREECPEFELRLPKLLCGWPEAQPLDRFLHLPEYAKQESHKVLTDVVEYWKVLQDTPVEALQSGFLQREGKLSRKASGDWQLRLEKSSIDILLDQLPWSLSVCQLPWMPNILFIDWK
jgi:hypothetical protein